MLRINITRSMRHQDSNTTTPTCAAAHTPTPTSLTALTVVCTLVQRQTHDLHAILQLCEIDAQRVAAQLAAQWPPPDNHAATASTQPQQDAAAHLRSAAATATATAIDQALGRKQRILALLDRPEASSSKPFPTPLPATTKQRDQHAQPLLPHRPCNQQQHQADKHTLASIRRWREQRHRAACVIQAAARRFLRRKRLLEQRRVTAAAAALCSKRLARVVRAWRRHCSLRAESPHRANAVAAAAPLLSASGCCHSAGAWEGRAGSCPLH